MYVTLPRPPGVVLAAAGRQESAHTPAGVRRCRYDGAAVLSGRPGPLSRATLTGGGWRAAGGVVHNRRFRVPLSTEGPEHRLADGA